jgi:7-cyano-7-deazaguanine synthase in queuosine biosynthesis
MKVMLYSGGLDSYLLALDLPRCDAYVYIQTEPRAPGLKQARLSLRRLFPTHRTDLTVLKMPAFWKATATKEQLFRNPLFLLAVAAHFRMGKRDTLYAAVRDAGHMYADCSYEFWHTMEKMSNALHGPRIDFPHFNEHLSETIKCLDVTHLPPLQSCNANSAKNCGKCMKCRVIKRQMKKAGVPELWDAMNRR